jgi:hypothetical protein
LAITALVIVHELGHAAVVLASGGSAEISLVGMMGLTSYESSLYRYWSRWRRAGVSAAGPLLGLLVAAVAWEAATGPVDSSGSAFLWVFAHFGVWLNLANLLPLTGLDGQALAMLAVRADENPGRAHVVRGVGVALAVVIVAIALHQRDVWLAAFVAMNAMCDVKRLRPGRQQLSQRATEQFRQLGLARDRGDLQTVARMTAALDAVVRAPGEREGVHAMAVDAHLMAGDVAGAERHYMAFVSESSRARARARVEMVRAPEQGWRLLTQLVAEMTGEQSAVIQPADGHGSEAASWSFIFPRLARISAYEATSIMDTLRIGKRWEATAQCAQALYRRGVIGPAAYCLAVASCQTGQADAALDWLRVAASSGYVIPRDLRGSVEFAPISELPAFAALTGVPSAAAWTSSDMPACTSQAPEARTPSPPAVPEVMVARTILPGQ